MGKENEKKDYDERGKMQKKSKYMNRGNRKKRWNMIYKM